MNNAVLVSLVLSVLYLLSLALAVLLLLEAGFPPRVLSAKHLARLKYSLLVDMVWIGFVVAVEGAGAISQSILSCPVRRILCGARADARDG